MKSFARRVESLQFSRSNMRVADGNLSRIIPEVSCRSIFLGFRWIFRDSAGYKLFGSCTSKADFEIAISCFS